MELYHYTSIEHALLILASGSIKKTGSNVSKREGHSSPDVVWLTSRLDLHDNWNPRRGVAIDKMSVRIGVEIRESDIAPWLAWARAHGTSERSIAAASKGGHPENWYVVERDVPASEWIEVAFARPEANRVAPGLGTVLYLIKDRDIDLSLPPSVLSDSIPFSERQALLNGWATTQIEGWRPLHPRGGEVP